VLDRQADQVALHGPIHDRPPLAHRAGKVFQPAHDQRQCRALRRLVTYLNCLLLPSPQPLAQPGGTRRKFGFVNQAFRIAVDQPAQAEAPLVLGRDPTGVFKHPLNLSPHRFVQPAGAHLLVRAQTPAAETIRITAATTIAGIMAPLAFGRGQADGLAMVCITALPADHQPLPQRALAAGALPATLAVLRQLPDRRLGRRRVDPGGTGTLIHACGAALSTP
jgi:hypothetical protein